MDPWAHRPNLGPIALATQQGGVMEKMVWCQKYGGPWIHLAFTGPTHSNRLNMTPQTWRKENAKTLIRTKNNAFRVRRHHSWAAFWRCLLSCYHVYHRHASTFGSLIWKCWRSSASRSQLPQTKYDGAPFNKSNFIPPLTSPFKKTHIHENKSINERGLMNSPDWFNV